MRLLYLLLAVGGLMMGLPLLLSGARPFIGIIFLLIGFFSIYKYSTNPETKKLESIAKKERAQQEEKKKLVKANLEKKQQNLEKKVQQVISENNSRNTLDSLLTEIQQFDLPILLKIFETSLIPLMMKFPLEKKVRDTVFKIGLDSRKMSLRQTLKFGEIYTSLPKLLYKSALEMLEDNPSNKKIKAFVLEVGRWSFGSQRGDGKATIYDEQAIQNDILTRAD